MPGKKKRAIRANRERNEGRRELNLDVLLIIYQYLDRTTLLRCAQVCKLWKKAAYSPSKWTRYLFCIKDEGLSTETALSLRERGISSVSLRLNQVDICDATSSNHKKSVFQTLLNCAAVVDVDTLLLLGRPIPAPAVCDMSQMVVCPKLPTEFAALHTLYFYNVDIFEKSFEAALEPLSNLAVLHLKWYNPQPTNYGPQRYERKDCSFDFLSIILSTVPSLVDLAVNRFYYTGWDDGGFTISEDISVLPNLESLAIDEYFISMKHQITKQIMHKFPMLKHLDIHVDTEHLRRNEEIENLPVMNCIQSFRQEGYNTTNRLESCYVLKQAIFPNLAALDLNCIYLVERVCPNDIGTLLSELLPQLEVLKLGGYGSLEAHKQFNIISQMKELKTLVINCFRETTNTTSPQPCWSLGVKSKLLSFLLVANHLYMDSFDPIVTFGLKGVKYRWCRDDNVVKKRVSLQDSNEDEWKQVPVGSEEWKQATGWHYFHLSGAFCPESHKRSGLEKYGIGIDNVRTP